jgi:hypothetical protein
MHANGLIQIRIEGGVQIETALNSEFQLAPAASDSAPDSKRFQLLQLPAGDISSKEANFDGIGWSHGRNRGPLTN